MDKKIFIETMKHYDIVMMGTVGFMDDEQIEHFLDLVEKESAQHSVHPTPLTLFGMRVEIANWLNAGQWFIRPSRRG